MTWPRRLGALWPHALKAAMMFGAESPMWFGLTTHMGPADDPVLVVVWESTTAIMLRVARRKANMVALMPKDICTARAKIRK